MALKHWFHHLYYTSQIFPSSLGVVLMGNLALQLHLFFLLFCLIFQIFLESENFSVQTLNPQPLSWTLLETRMFRFFRTFLKLPWPNAFQFEKYQNSNLQVVFFEEVKGMVDILFITFSQHNVNNYEVRRRGKLGSKQGRVILTKFKWLSNKVASYVNLLGNI